MDLDIVFQGQNFETLPHIRHSCPEHPHLADESKLNEKYCDKCYW